MVFQEQFTVATAGHGAMHDLTAQVDEANIAAKEAKSAAASSAELKTAVDSAYLFGMIGIAVGVAGIVIGVAALSRREKV